MATKGIYLPGLNGIRAIAALAVLIGHVSMTIRGFHHVDLMPFKIEFGGYAVTMFFTLSGFLITYLLLIEKEKAGTVNIKQFYFRRILRIWPLYYLYLVLSLLLIFFFKLDVPEGQLLYYVFLCGNIPIMFMMPVYPLIAHFWSIGVEEQFYLFWPWVVKYSKKIFAVIIAITIILIMARICLRLLELRYGYKFFIGSNFFVFLRFQCMAIGGIGAYLYYKGKNISILTNPLLNIFSWGIFLLCFANELDRVPFFGHEVLSIATVFIIVSQITGRNKIFSLENKLFNFLGKLSYGIYVIHPMVLFFIFKYYSSIGADGIFSALLLYLSAILFTVLLSYLSYNYYERRFLKLKSKFAIVKSSPDHS
jgi:peptidoglycan/LPS O-acetylase OafA/YrhL